MMLFVNGTCSFWSEDLFYDGGRKPDHDERSVFFLKVSLNFLVILLFSLKGFSFF